MSKTTTKKPGTKPAPASDDGTLTVQRRKDESDVKAMARVCTDPDTTAATTLRTFSVGTMGNNLDLTACMEVVAETAKAVHGGDLRHAETMLTAQAMSLNMIFTELARRSALNMGEYPDAFERYMRLALKAQGQCRATLETLAAIKNPPVVFARQANINNGGQQQVNNGTAPPESLPAASASPATLEAGRPVESLPAPAMRTGHLTKSSHPQNARPPGGRRKV
jgi:hypothetical protein